MKINEESIIYSIRKQQIRHLLFYLFAFEGRTVDDNNIVY